MELCDALVDRVLDCANRTAGTTFSLPPGDDLSLSEFDFDSLSAFAFIIELESQFGLAFDEGNLDIEELHSIRSVAALVLRSQAQPGGVRDEPGS